MSDKTIDQFVETIHELESQLEAVKAERDELKAMIEKHQKLQQGMLDALTQAEKERDEVLNQIEAFAWDIKGDWTDPRANCKSIIELCNKHKITSKE